MRVKRTPSRMTRRDKPPTPQPVSPHSSRRRGSPSEWKKLREAAERYTALVGGPGISTALQLLEKATRAEEWFKERAAGNPLGIPSQCGTAEESLEWMKRERHHLMSGKDAPRDVNPVLCRWIWLEIERARAGEYFAPGGSYSELRAAVADLIPQPGSGKQFMSPLWSEREAVVTYHQSRQGWSDEYLVKVSEIERGERDGVSGWLDPVKPEALARIRTLKFRGRTVLYKLYGRDEDKPVRNRKP